MNQTIEKLKALADETRLRIMNLFIKSGQNLCVCELMDELQIPQYTVSKSLNILKSAGLFITEKEGTWVYYKLNKNEQQNKILFNFLRNYLSTEHFLTTRKD